MQKVIQGLSLIATIVLILFPVLLIMLISILLDILFGNSNVPS